MEGITELEKYCFAKPQAVIQTALITDGWTGEEDMAKHPFLRLPGGLHRKTFHLK